MSSAHPSEGDTPMMRQYHAIRRDLPSDVLLLFRLGDFYEIFFEDAKIAAPILNISLTKRNSVPMCGVPHHASQTYIARLIQAGKRVAIADQTSEPKPGKLVERAVSQIISPGSVEDTHLSDHNRANWLASVHFDGKNYGLAYTDLTTGAFWVCEYSDFSPLQDELARLQPAEILHSEDLSETLSPLLQRTGLRTQPMEGYPYLLTPAKELLLDHFHVQSLDGFGCAPLKVGLSAAGAALHYIRFQLRRDASHLRRIQVADPGNFVPLDITTQNHLELVTSRGGFKHTLLHSIDRTVTPMGARRLRDWILHPLREISEIQDRQDAVQAFLDDPSLLHEWRENLTVVRDLERLIARLAQGSGNPRDLLALANGLDRLPSLKATLIPLTDQSSLLKRIRDQIHPLPQLSDHLRLALVEEPPATLKDGGIFREGWSSLLDELRSASTEGRRWIADLQAKEIERTGIKSLKIRYNAVFGYFIEITKANLNAVPDDYQRKQTTVNSERFITPELKQVENKILGADERAKAIETEEFLALRQRVLEHLDLIQSTANALSDADALSGMAETARLYGYTRPVLFQDRRLVIEAGRHPVLDQTLTSSRFVPNDTQLDADGDRLMLITGPNMAGKSTYIRQVALLVLLSQIGAFIPAKHAEIGLVDRIFTRVGASDDLSRGQSTFMVEMNETSYILNHATRDSLVILDEIGRGTSTFDGLSIAWSVAEHLHSHLGSRTLFATHYHELTALGRDLPGVTNWNVAVREWNDQVIFLHQIIPGAADKSYGIQVARLAGIPQPVLDRAKEILAGLEAGQAPVSSVAGTPEVSVNQRPTRTRWKEITDPSQLHLGL